MKQVLTLIVAVAALAAHVRADELRLASVFSDHDFAARHGRAGLGPGGGERERDGRVRRSEKKCCGRCGRKMAGETGSPAGQRRAADADGDGAANGYEGATCWSATSGSPPASRTWSGSSPPRLTPTRKSPGPRTRCSATSWSRRTRLPRTLDDTEGQWLAAGPQTAGGFSALGYYFAKKLQGELKVPWGWCMLLGRHDLPPGPGPATRPLTACRT